MHASSPGRGLFCPARPDSDAVCAQAGFASPPPPPREKLPAHVVHDDGTRAALDALVEAHYPCAVVRARAPHAPRTRAHCTRVWRCQQPLPPRRDAPAAHARRAATQTVCDALEADEPIIYGACLRASARVAAEGTGGTRSARTRGWPAAPPAAPAAASAGTLAARGVAVARFSGPHRALTALHLVLQPANRLFESCTGYDAIEVLGKNWGAAATPSSRARRRRPAPMGAR